MDQIPIHFRLLLLQHLLCFFGERSGLGCLERQLILGNRLEGGGLGRGPGQRCTPIRETMALGSASTAPPPLWGLEPTKEQATLFLNSKERNGGSGRLPGPIL